jgi:hypothetical protein
MNHISDTANTLADLYRQRAMTNFSAWQTNQDIKARQLELTPADGWPGKNEAARETAMGQAFATDEIIHNLVAAQASEQFDLARITGGIEALEAERRAEEWRIRDGMRAALETKGIQHNGRGDHVEAAFDDALQHAMDGRLFSQAQESHDLAYAEDDLPF